MLKLFYDFENVIIVKDFIESQHNFSQDYKNISFKS